MTRWNAAFSIRIELNSIFKTPLFVRKYRKIIRIKCFCLLKFSFLFYLYIYLIYVIILICASGRSWRLVMRTQLSPRAAVSYILTQAMDDYPPGIFTFAGQTEMHRQIHGAVHTKKPREWERFYTSLNQNFSLRRRGCLGYGKAIPEDGKQPLRGHIDNSNCLTAWAAL